MRVSRRELDEKLSTKFCPVLAQKRELKLSKGEIVPVDIAISWPRTSAAMPVCSRARWTRWS